MPHFSVSNVTLRGGKCHTWMGVKCGICLAQVWRLPCPGVAFALPGCGICFARCEFTISMSSWFHSRKRCCPAGRGIVGDETTQVGASAVDALFVAVRVGWCGGLLLGIECQEGCVQGLRSALSGICEIHEIAACIAFAQQVAPFVVDFDMFLEAGYGRLDVSHQQFSVAAVYAGCFQPGCSHGQSVHHFLPGTYGVQWCFRSAEVIANGEWSPTSG